MAVNTYSPAKKHAALTTGEVIRMLRELKGWTQEELARRSGLNAKNISLLENNRVDIGKRRTEHCVQSSRGRAVLGILGRVVMASRRATGSAGASRR